MYTTYSQSGPLGDFFGLTFPKGRKWPSCYDCTYSLNHFTVVHLSTTQVKLTRATARAVKAWRTDAQEAGHEVHASAVVVARAGGTLVHI